MNVKYWSYELSSNGRDCKRCDVIILVRYIGYLNNGTSKMSKWMINDIREMNTCGMNSSNQKY